MEARASLSANSIIQQAKCMNQTNTSLVPRRSSRVPTSIPILVTSLDPKSQFSEVCEALIVSAHGCAMRSRVKLDAGVRVNFHSREGRNTTAQVVACQPINSDTQSWMLTAKLDRPDNFWGLPNCPKDWVAAAIPALSARSYAALAPRPSHGSNGQASTGQALNGQTAEAARGPLAPQISETDVKRIIAETLPHSLAASLRPIQAEAAALKELREKMLRKEANPSRFDVSLSSIPPELEQQLESRLRKDLEPKLLQEARHLAAQLLTEAQATISQKTKEAQEHLSHSLAGERRAFEQQAQEISARISESVRQRISAGLNEFQQKLVEGGNQLKKLSHELLEFLQGSLEQEYKERWEELERLRAMITSESLRLQELTEHLNGRTEKLDESVRTLESSLDHRLNEMCSRTVQQMRSELQNAAEAALKEFADRGQQALGAELDQARGKLEHAQKEIIASASEALEVQTANALRAFDTSTQDLASASLERWRWRLNNGLSALAKSLDEERS